MSDIDIPPSSTADYRQGTLLSKQPQVLVLAWISWLASIVWLIAATLDSGVKYRDFGKTWALTTCVSISIAVLLNYHHDCCWPGSYYETLIAVRPVRSGSKVLAALIAGPFFSWWLAVPVGLIYAVVCHVGNPDTSFPFPVVCWMIGCQCLVATISVFSCREQGP